MDGDLVRVVQIINSFGHQSGGAERLAQDLHVDLLAAGVDAHLVALEQCDASQLENAVSLGFSSSYKPGAIFALRKYLGGLMSKPDVIHAHLFPTSVCVASLKKIGAISCPVVFTEHNTSNRRREKAIMKPLDGAVYGAFKKIYCISDGTKTSLVNAYPHLLDKTEVIENGATLHFDRFLSRASGPAIKVLSVGRLSKQKNYPVALDAISRLKDADITYTILGEGSAREALEDQVEVLGLTGQVTFEGHKSDITPFLEDADVFLIPSLWEGFGLAVVEGMNAGLPVVASDVPGLREVVGTDGVCAYLVAPSDPEAIAAALRRLADADIRRTMGEAGFERSKRFDRQRMTEAYIAAYRLVAQEAMYA